MIRNIKKYFYVGISGFPLFCPSSEGDSDRASNRIYQTTSESNFKKEPKVSGSNTNALPPPFASPEQIRGVIIYNVLVDISTEDKSK